MPTLSPATPRPPHPEERELGRIAFHSLCSAACAVVPIPFLDDHLVKLTRRRMVRELCVEQRMSIDAPQLAVLSGTAAKPLGCGCIVGLLVSLGFKLVLKLIRRVFRTVLFWLTVKDAADAASQTLHEGYLVASALKRQRADHEAGHENASTERRLGDEEASALRDAVDSVLARSDTRALNHVFRGVLSGSQELFGRLARGLTKLRSARDQADGGEEDLERELEDAIPSSLIERVARRLRSQSDYLDRLDEQLAGEFFLRGVRAEAADADPAQQP